jgi:hypothetical protein
LLFTIGQCERRLGHEARAVLFYRQFLNEARADAPQRPEVERRIAELEQILREREPVSPEDRRPPRAERDSGSDSGAPPEVSRAPPPPARPPPARPPLVVAPGPAPAPRVPLVRLGASAGASFVSLSGGTVSMPVLAVIRLSGTYAFRLPGGFLDLGALATATPLPYESRSATGETSFLWGAYAAAHYRHPIGDAFHLGAGAAAGLVLWTGLGEGDPFTVAHTGTAGPVAMPSFRLGPECAVRVTRDLFLTAGLAYAFIKTATPALTRSISSMAALELAAGAGYTF